MVEYDVSDAKRIVGELGKESTDHQRRFLVWLGVGSGGGAVAMLSFSAQLPNPDHALRTLLPSLAIFAVGVVTAAASTLSLAGRQSAGAEHHACSANRDQYANAIRRMPEVFASAQRVADEMNAERNRMIAKHDKEHAEAEAAWSRRERWDRLYRICIVLSSLAFVGGASWPLAVISSGHSLAGHEPRTSTVAVARAAQ